MGTDKNIKLHIVTDIKRYTKTRTRHPKQQKQWAKRTRELKPSPTEMQPRGPRSSNKNVRNVTPLRPGENIRSDPTSTVSSDGKPDRPTDTRILQLMRRRVSPGAGKPCGHTW